MVLVLAFGWGEPYSSARLCLPDYMSVHPNFIEELKQMLPADQIDAYMDACQRPLKKSITITQHRISDEDLL